MFSFHKPKVYRSSTGCCICKAKSSSSRFTDSKKYEDDFVECFQLQERRTGEICNACVLLVKRWKKLPAGSDRNWSHVVDGRAGPGIKSLTKFKSKNKKKMKDKLDKSDKVKKKHIYLKSETEREHSPAMSDDLIEYYNSMEPESKGSSRSESPADIDSIIEKQMDVVIEESDLKKNVNEFIDLSYFKREIICCGTIFKGPHGEIIVDPSQFKLCINCLEAKRQQQRENDSSSTSEAASPVHSASTSPVHSVELPEATRTTVVAVVQQNNQVSKSNTFSDSSSDSGYDEYSSQRTDSNKTVKNIQKIKLLPSSVEQMDQTTCKSLTVVSDSSQIQPVSN